MNKTAIGWTDFSANPLKYRDATGRVVWGCEKVSAGCTHCYSEALAKRWNNGGDYNAHEMDKLTPFLDEKELRRMLTYKPASGKRCFVGDMTDVFGEWVPDDLLDRLFAVFALRSDVTWQVLTKRAERMRVYLSSETFERIAELVMAHQYGGFDVESEFDARDAHEQLSGFWPLPNVWLGVSCEDQQRANERIPLLLQTPAAVRFVSAEPLLGRVLLDNGDTSWLTCREACTDETEAPCVSFMNTGRCFHGLDWIIVGGESGPKFRACDVEAITNLTAQCQAASVPVFVKQDAHRLPGQQGRISDAFWLKEFPA